MRWLLAWSLVSVVATNCGSTTAPGVPADPTVRFTSTGVTPRELSVNRRGRVTFINDDTRPHHPASDLHPEHTICPELNLPTLQPGERVRTVELVNARDCLFHDDLHVGDERYTGRVLVGLQ